MVKTLVEVMTKEFEMSLVGELNYLQINQTEKYIFISQSVYARNLLQRLIWKHVKMLELLSTTTKLCKDEAGESVDENIYRRIIGSLLYLTTSRPDICLSVGVCDWYQAHPKVSHLNAVKCILKYVKGILNHGLYYSKETNQNLVSYYDANWAGSIDDRCSTSGGSFFLGNNLISWHNKKHNCVTLSTAEAEYISMGSCCTQLLW